MTIDEAIKHAEEVAERCEFDSDWGMGNHFIDRSGVADVIECAKEHRQLAEWLRELKKFREQQPIIDVSNVPHNHIRLEFCEYCNEDVDGFVTPLEKNGHAFVRFGMNGWELSLKANGWHGSAKIRYCPMCGRDLYAKMRGRT